MTILKYIGIGKKISSSQDQGSKETHQPDCTEIQIVGKFIQDFLFVL